ncbi:myo-inositol-1(or 4)-monophosphatase [Pseudonocardia autotrophica]|uniref:inositol-phosphate phosphatase n=1 Tax=Pseudonocardia autotrophica TaxID=2074 RepID=A0A1Y2MM44_PSEAH|nr:Inositol-1-monophosphatase SuhB [Pseudonocardia autotrophica]TDN70985.1 myo-inositol-1(or 4)-monophosphatase [Pseudonocardia autotrophica]
MFHCNCAPREGTHLTPPRASECSHAWSDGAVSPHETSDSAALRAVAEQVAAEAAEHLRSLPAPRGAAGAGAAGAVSTKSSPTDVVTASDASVERFVRDRLAQLRPGEPVYGEEGAGDAATARWVVDPIDGTVNYLYGLPWYAISIAAVEAGATVAGAVAEPASGRLWSAGRGLGATCDGRPLAVAATTEIGQSLIGTGFAYRAERRARQARMVAAMLPEVRDVRRAGAAALDLCAVAAGWLDGYLEHGCNWWDWAAGALIAREAGAVLHIAVAPGMSDLAGAGGTVDGLGDDVTLAVAPGVAGDLVELARRSGAAQV